VINPAGETVIADRNQTGAANGEGALRGVYDDDGSQYGFVLLLYVSDDDSERYREPPSPIS